MGSRTKPSQTAKVSRNQLRSTPTSRLMARPNSHRKMLRHRYTLIAMILVLIIVACTNTSESEFSQLTQSPTESTALRIWWDKGFNPEEDEALQQLVSNWEQKTGHKIKLTFYTTDERSQKAQRFLQAGNLPDIIMSFKAESTLNPRLAWEGKLVDVSDIIEPVKNLYPESVLQTVRFYNNVEQKWSYYGVPIHQATIHIYYRRDLLEQVGRTDKDIPQDWDSFWEFWKQVHDDLQAQQKQDIYGLGLPMSVEAGDTYQSFEQILEAYDVRILDSEGQLQVDQPQVRRGIIKCLDWYTQFYQQGYVPPDAVNWLNPDNNRNLLNRVIVMTPNATLSIPAAVRQDPDTYRNKLGIIEFPNKPNGQPLHNIFMVEQAALLAESKHQKLAKEFLTYMLQPEVMNNYLKASGGRNSPVQKPVWKDPFWSDPKDPHISTATKTLTEGRIRLFYTFQNPAYSTVLKENVWGKALKRIVVDGISPEEGADQAIERIQQIFDEWESN